MYREGHVGAALLAYAPVGFVVAAAGFRFLSLIGGIGVAALAMLPDYDQKVPGVDHRGPTHTVWFAVVVGVVTIGSHIAADALTPAGVRPFAPVRTRRYTTTSRRRRTR